MLNKSKSVSYSKFQTHRPPLNKMTMNPLMKKEPKEEEKEEAKIPDLKKEKSVKDLIKDIESKKEPILTQFKNVDEANIKPELKDTIKKLIYTEKYKI